MNVVITVKAAVYTVVFTIIGNVERGEEIEPYCQSGGWFPVLTVVPFPPERARQQEKAELSKSLRGTSLMGQGSADVLSGVSSIIISIYLV